MKSIPQVNYFEHPAFTGYKVNPSESTEELHSTINLATCKLQKLKAFSDDCDLPKASLKGELKRIHRDCTDVYNQSFKKINRLIISSRDDWTKWELETIKKFCIQLSVEYQRLMSFYLEKIDYKTKKRNKISSIESQYSLDLDMIRRDGLKVFHIDPAQKAHLVDSLKAHISHVKSHPESYLNLTAKLKIRRIIVAAVGEFGLDKIASSYLGTPVKLTEIALGCNDEFHSFYPSKYLDLGIVGSATKSMHFDSNSGMMKSIVYLSSVSDKDGPFSYVVGSHKWDIDLFHKISGQSWPYSKVTLRSERERRLFLKMPSEFRFMSHFGDDLIDGSEIQNRILKKEKRITSDYGDVILFDNYGLHRGGITDGGERIALQLQFSTDRLYLITRLRGDVMNMLSRLIKRIRGSLA